MATLERENHPSISEPSWSQVEEALSGIHPRKSSFVILGDSSKGYIQAAGARLRLIIELRKKKMFGFAHYVLGRSHDDTEQLTSINYSGGSIALFPSEIFSADDAKEAFRALFDSSPLPARFHLRDVTEEHRQANKRPEGTEERYPLSKHSQPPSVPHP